MPTTPRLRGWQPASMRWGLQSRKLLSGGAACLPLVEEHSTFRTFCSGMLVSMSRRQNAPASCRRPSTHVDLVWPYSLPEAIAALRHGFGMLRLTKIVLQNHDLGLVAVEVEASQNTKLPALDINCKNIDLLERRLVHIQDRIEL